MWWWKSKIGFRWIIFQENGNVSISFSVKSEEWSHRFRTKHTYLIHNSPATECNAFQFNIGVKNTCSVRIHIRVYVYGFRIVASCCYWGLFSFSHIQLQCSAVFSRSQRGSYAIWNFLVYKIRFFFHLQTTEQTMERSFWWALACPHSIQWASIIETDTLHHALWKAAQTKMEQHRSKCVNVVTRHSKLLNVQMKLIKK